ncbi:hypothetical protein QOZ80_6AG0521560 [Eleusine coracana subsp. coracana]|nr:hypothetical protein QOZ80_6AG0521560 [Eleusine coracana subsp. coracana]
MEGAPAHRRARRVQGAHAAVQVPVARGHHTTTPRFHMCVFLPDARDGLLRLVDLASGPEDFIHDHLPTDKVDVGKLRLPRCKMSFESKLNQMLKEMGVGAAFDPDRANLSDMAEDDGSGLPLVVQDVFHKAIIEVNEEGTKAAAFTYGGMMVGCAAPWIPRQIVDFIADHPFFFFIIEQQSRAVVFAGYVLEPSKE